MKLVMDGSLISVADVETIFINHKPKGSDREVTDIERIEADPNWGIVKKVWYSVRSMLFGYPTRKVKRTIPAQKHWKLEMTYRGEDGQQHVFQSWSDDYKPVKDQFDRIVAQLPNNMMAKVNAIMFEDPK